MYSDIHQEIERCLNEKLEEKERERRQVLRPLEGGGVVPQDEKVKLPRVHFFSFGFLHICACRLIRRSADVPGNASASMQRSIRTWVRPADLWLKAHAGLTG